MKMTRLAVLVAIALWASPAVAREVSTPLLGKSGANDYLCMIYNAGKKPIEVTIQIWDPVFLVTNVTANRTIQPERSTTVLTAFGTVSTCRVSGHFSPKKAPITFCVATPGTTACGATVTSP